MSDLVSEILSFFFFDEMLGWCLCVFQDMITFSAFILGGLAIFIMYTALKSTQRPSRDAQGKMCGLMIVIGAVGLLLIYNTHDKIPVSSVVYSFGLLFLMEIFGRYKDIQWNLT
jgi:hypothetical protein